MNGEVKAILVAELNRNGVGSAGVRKLWKELKEQVWLLYDQQQIEEAREYLSKMLEKGIEVLCQEEGLYPEPLRILQNPPFMLFCKGNLELISQMNVSHSYSDDKVTSSDKLFEVRKGSLEEDAELVSRGMIARKNLFRPKVVGIVGTRRITDYGKKLANFVIPEWAKSNIIVSGLAYGVDREVLSIAVARGFPVIAIVPGGIDEGCPVGNRDLEQSIIDNGGLILAEFPIGRKPIKGMFPMRNRLIAAISQKLVVVESQEIGGAMITADYAKGLDRELWTFPTNIFMRNASGLNKLIKGGAKLIIEEKDLYQLYGLPWEQCIAQLKREKDGENTINNNNYNREFINETDSVQDTIIRILKEESGGLYIEEILSKINNETLKIQQSELFKLLTKLDLQGILRRKVDGRYILNEGENEKFNHS